jgi:hypothetical protein
MPKREKFTNLEYRPFKALVVGSSPTQPKNLVPLRKPAEPLWKPFGGRSSTVYLEISFSYQLLLLLFFGLLLANSARLTAVWGTFPYFMTFLAGFVAAVWRHLLRRSRCTPGNCPVILSRDDWKRELSSSVRMASRSSCHSTRQESSV